LNTPSGDWIYAVQDLEQTYGSRTVLSLDSLRIARGAVTALTGPNGCGKSTLLRILSFLEDPTSGTILFEGKPCSCRSLSVRGEVTMLLQEPYLLKRSVLGNVTYGLRLKKAPGNVVAKAYAALELVGLDPAGFASRAWFELSGGEKQRVSLAARLALEPKVLLLDEPISNVDEASSALIDQATLWAKQKLGATVIVASHDRRWLEKICDAEIQLIPGQAV
jgi:tungstate transport system ATP-binding protein